MYSNWVKGKGESSNFSGEAEYFFGEAEYFTREVGDCRPRSSR